ncbi:hypothetical protein [Microseira sp. BLCC-F43]|jgi:hypothetical protein|uniref:hypothetical protein n=1 Tax=Microseira sp. BLCC-F43 TaxID=3153602 RepID=UPI0035B7B2AB
MNGKLSNFSFETADVPTDSAAPNNHFPEADLGLEMNVETLADYIARELKDRTQLGTKVETVHPASLQMVAMRIAAEVVRICRSSARIQRSGCVRCWQLSLARHRIAKCLKYYYLGSKQARIELHSTLGAIAYRYITPMRSPVSFQVRYHLLEDFLQSFFIESLTVFRRENQLAENYTPRTTLELAEYMAFSEQYARRRITLKRGGAQQLLVLRAQGFSRRQPAETTLDMELAAEPPRDDGEPNRCQAMQQVRASMVSEAIDPAESFLRDRVIEELVEYLESNGQSDCVDYLILKLQDFSAPEIDDILGLEARRRDYLQQRFKYHVEKFAKAHQWQLVHQWLGADLDDNLGLNEKQWQAFCQQLQPQQQQLLQFKRDRKTDSAIAQYLQWTTKQVQRQWFQLLELAWQFRNGTFKPKVSVSN